MKEKIFSLLVLLILLSGCSDDRCIDADDFGFARVTISSRYPKQTTSTDPITGVTQTFDYIMDYQGKDVGAWLDTGFQLNGQPLTIMVKNWKYDKLRNNATPNQLSAWSPWFGRDKYSNSLPPYLYNLRSCQFANNDTCSTAGVADAQRILNAPCLMKQGIGLYGLATKPNASDPNATAVSRYNPEGFAFHVGDPKNTVKLFDIDNSFQLFGRGNVGSSRAGGILVNDNMVSNYGRDYNGGKLYFKILDNYYDDNAGQYVVVIKTGVRNVGFDPFAAFADKFRVMFFGDGNVNGQKGIVQKIYENLLSQTGFRNAVTGMLTLYIMVTGMGFLIGIVKFTQHELISRVFKVVLISVLISADKSWEFFNTYFFNLFINGLQELIGFVQQAATGGKTQGGESLLSLIFAEQTFAKLLALILTDFHGFFYFIIFVVLMYFIVIMYLKAWILYISSLIMIGCIISLAPIFICFLLFKVTRSLFDNWLKQLIVYSFQPILLFTSLAFLGSMVRDEIYNSLGFRVCAIPIIDIGITEKPLLSMYYPQPSSPSYFNNNKIEMSVPKPEDVYDSAGNLLQSFKAYERLDYRYQDIPFLDPNNPKDQERIAQFKDKGAFVQFDGLVYLILIVWILHYFNESTVSIANSIIGSGANATNLQPAVNNVSQGVQDMLDTALSNSSVYRGFKKAYSLGSRVVRTAATAVEYAGNYVEAGLEMGLSKYADFSNSTLLVSNSTKQNFAKKHGWIAKGLGIGSGEKEMEKVSGMWEGRIKGTGEELQTSWGHLHKESSDLYHDAKDAAIAAGKKVKDTAIAAGKTIYNLPKNIKDTAGSVAQGIKDLPKNIQKSATAMREGIENMPSKVVDGIKSAPGYLASGAANSLNYVGRSVNNIATRIGDNTNTLFQNVQRNTGYYLKDFAANYGTRTLEGFAGLLYDNDSHSSSYEDKLSEQAAHNNQLLSAWQESRSEAAKKYDEGLKEIKGKNLSAHESKTATSQLKAQYNKELREISHKYRSDAPGLHNSLTNVDPEQKVSGKTKVDLAPPVKKA